MSLALPALSSEVPHKIFVGITNDVISICMVTTEIWHLVTEYAEQFAELVYHFLALAKLVLIVKVCVVNNAPEVVCFG